MNYPRAISYAKHWIMQAPVNGDIIPDLPTFDW
jgi:hypothetical protein